MSYITESAEMKLKELLRGVNVIETSGDCAGDVSALCYAADQCRKDSLFVAVPGLNHDGHDFISEAIARGARYVVHERDYDASCGATTIKVSGSRRALGILSKNYFNHPSAEIFLVGVTGTSGKTTVTYLLESIWQAAGFRSGVLGTVNYRFGGKINPAQNTTPESYELQKILREMTDDGITHVVTEVSSHALDLRRVDDCDFDLAIFTNLTPEHLDYHRTMEAYYEAKKRLFAEVLVQSAKNNPLKMVINADDEWGRKLLREVSLPVYSYGMSDFCAVKAHNYECTLSGIKAELELPGEVIFLSSPLIGKFNMYNILAAAAAANIMQIPPAAIKRGIENMRCVPGRMERIESSCGCYVFVDYAHKADALVQVLQNLTKLKEKRIITIFGCGGNRDREKRPMMGRAAATYSELTIITSDNPRLEDPLAIIAEIEAGIDQAKAEKISPDDLSPAGDRHRYTIIPDRKKAIEQATAAAGEGDIILIAGKGHEDYQIVGTKKFPFDDRRVAAQALKRREKN